MLMRPAKMFGMLICLIGLFQLAEAQCKQPKDEDSPHGRGEATMVSEREVGRIYGRVLFRDDKAQEGWVRAKDVVVEVYSYGGGENREDVSKVLREQKRAAACLTGGDGKFSFPDLKPGRYLFRAGTRKQGKYNEIHVILLLDPALRRTPELTILLPADDR